MKSLQVQRQERARTVVDGDVGAANGELRRRKV
jgi:hypothetical protein